MDPQLKKGILKICILQLINQEDQYGYDIVKKLHEFFEDTEESTIYAILRRMFRENYTMVYYSDISNGPKRKYYKITKRGNEYLSDCIDSWNKVQEVFYNLGIVS